MSSLFESKVCTRCGGTGNFSFCPRYGSTCFKCHGAGDVLTKRGAATQKYLNELRTKKASDFIVGDVIKCTGFPSYWFARITEIRTGWQIDKRTPTHPRLTFITENKKVGTHTVQTYDHHQFRIGETAEQKTASREAALAYQATLTKAGTPRKRKPTMEQK
jgi:hypothetical protein